MWSLEPSQKNAHIHPENVSYFLGLSHPKFIMISCEGLTYRLAMYPMACSERHQQNSRHQTFSLLCIDILQLFL